MNRLKNLFLLLAGVVMLASCSMMETDRSGCPGGVYVKFVYDYNVQRADMRKDHVGGITVYVFDESDRLVMRRDVENEGDRAPLRSYDYAMHFNPGELPAGRYRLVAVAQQKGYEAALATPGAKFRRTDLQPGDARDGLRIRLDRGTAADMPAAIAGTPDGDGEARPVSAEAPLDTLWTGTTVNPDRTADEQGEAYIEVRDGLPTYATVYLVRDTKHIHVEMRQLEEPTDISDTDFAVTVTAGNGLLDGDNTLLDDEKLVYSPYHAWTLDSEGGYRMAHYDLNCSRLTFDDERAAGNARLRIYDKKNRRDVVVADLPRWLIEGRITPEYRYGAQEYLDRQYDYRIEVVLRGATWHEVYIHVQLNMLNWAKRIQNVDL